MSEIDFRRINLNLLPALRALLHERGVSAAARRMGVTQSAMSHSLAKLRELLDDPLLVPSGRALVPTPRGEELMAALPEALDRLRTVLEGDERFDPRTARRSFTVAALDYFELTTLPTLWRYLQRHAPGIDLQVERVRRESLARLGAGELDLMLAGTSARIPMAGLRSRELYREPFEVIARPDHPRIRGRLDLDTYLELDHVLIRVDGAKEGLVDRMLHASGRRRRIALTVPHFVAAPLAVMQSDLVATVASGVAARARQLFGLRSYPPPLELPSATIAMWWPRAHEADPARRWLRGLFETGVAAPPSIRRAIREHARTLE